MTGRGVYALPNGGLYDSSVGLYYPDRPVYIRMINTEEKANVVAAAWGT